MNYESSHRGLPESYIYNKYNFTKENSSVKGIDINIDDYVCELIQCGSDRNKFNKIMNSLEKKFLDGEDLSSDNEMNNNSKASGRYEKFSFIKNLIIDHESLSENTNRSGNNRSDRLKYHASNKNSNNDRSGYSHNNYSERNVISSSSKLVNHSSSNNPCLDKPFIQKKYTDVHANTKFYYPDNYYQDADELSLDKSQWTDRANTSTFYSRQTTNNSYLSNAFNQNYNNSDYYSKYHKYPDKMNKYFIPNSSMMEDSIRSNRNHFNKMTNKNFTSDDL